MQGKVSRDYITSGLRLDARPVNISRTTQFGNVECNIRTINCQFAVVISPQTMVVKKITIKDITAGEYIALVGGAWSAALLIVTIVSRTCGHSEPSSPCLARSSRPSHPKPLVPLTSRFTWHASGENQRRSQNNPIPKSKLRTPSI